MWILPSRGRPGNLRRLIKAATETHMSTPVWLRLDEDDPSLPDYLATPLPALWEREVGLRLPLSSIYNEAFLRDPEHPWWGVIADDVVPRTREWDTKLVLEALLYGMAVPAGGHDPDGAPHFVLSGTLVRSIGWLALPGLDRLYIDQVWLDIAQRHSVLKRVPEVLLEHRHFSNGKAFFDETYKKHYKERDKTLYEAWKSSCTSLPKFQ